MTMSETKTAAATLLANCKTANEVCVLLASGTVDVDAASKRIGELVKPAQGGTFTVKASEKGAVSVYGLQRMPVTLYAGQWERLLSDDNVKTIKEFIAAHPDLARKS
jgi:hypothetical protein